MKKKRAASSRQLLKKLFAQFARQVEELERRSGNNTAEAEAKSLAALAATLERLTELKAAQDEVMKKRDGKHVRGLDRAALIRSLCERLEKLSKQEEPKKPRSAGDNPKRRAG